RLLCCEAGGGVHAVFVEQLQDGGGGFVIDQLFQRGEVDAAAGAGGQRDVAQVGDGDGDVAAVAAGGPGGDQPLLALAVLAGQDAGIGVTGGKFARGNAGDKPIHL